MINSIDVIHVYEESKVLLKCLYSIIFTYHIDMLHMDSLTVPSLSPSTGSQLNVDEMKLLAKLEEQNLLLEIDSKSLYSVNGVLRGVPAHLWPVVWQLLCDTQNVVVWQKYSDLLKSLCPSEKLILRDLTRILPQHQLFHNKVATCQKSLFNVLKAYSILDRDIGYCQGSVFIVGLLQMAEEEAFYIFLRLMKDFGMRDLYRSNMVELSCCIYQSDAMIKVNNYNSALFKSTWIIYKMSFPKTLS
uniref:Rab-GAP TBC domain-containing protein n=1 Tax=Cyprinus carpio TaxID=7962 RepID=A0A8C1SGG6_CYPCA